jgi:hypothetical protein
MTAAPALRAIPTNLVLGVKSIGETTKTIVNSTNCLFPVTDHATGGTNDELLSGFPLMCRAHAVQQYGLEEANPDPPGGPFHDIGMDVQINISPSWRANLSDTYKGPDAKCIPTFSNGEIIFPTQLVWLDIFRKAKSDFLGFDFDGYRYKINQHIEAPPAKSAPEAGSEEKGGEEEEDDDDDDDGDGDLLRDLGKDGSSEAMEVDAEAKKRAVKKQKLEDNKKTQPQQVEAQPQQQQQPPAKPQIQKLCTLEYGARAKNLPDIFPSDDERDGIVSIRITDRGNAISAPYTTFAPSKPNTVFRLSFPMRCNFIRIQREAKAKLAQVTGSNRNQHTLDTLDGATPSGREDWEDQSIVGEYNVYLAQILIFNYLSSALHGSSPTLKHFDAFMWRGSEFQEYLVSLLGAIQQVNYKRSLGTPNGLALQKLRETWLEGALPEDIVGGCRGIFRNMLRCMSIPKVLKHDGKSFLAPINTAPNTTFVAGVGFVATTDIYNEGWLVIHAREAMREEDWISLKVGKLNPPSCLPHTRILRDPEDPIKASTNFNVPNRSVYKEGYKM